METKYIPFIVIGLLTLAALTPQAVAVSPCQLSLDGDLNRDCRVNMTDLAWLASFWLEDLSAQTGAYLPDGIYVSESTGFNSGTCGGMFAPCASINQGISRAVSTAKQYVFVADGLYFETITMANGVNLWGGFDPMTWVRQDPARSGSTIAALASAAHCKTIIAAYITAPTEISGFHIKAAEPSLAEKNSYAVWILNSDSDFVLKNNTVSAARGADGSDGSDGKGGIDGPNGAGGTGAANAMGSVVSNEWKGAAGTAGQDAVAGGKGGTAGGGTFGIFVINTAPSANRPALLNNTILPGRGGNGGDGGLGGFSDLKGVGGGGGGGAGGIACGIYTWNLTGSPDYHLSNSFIGTNTGGSGGKAGKSYANPGTPGTTGAALDSRYAP